MKTHRVTRPKSVCPERAARSSNGRLRPLEGEGLARVTQLVRDKARLQVPAPPEESGILTERGPRITWGQRRAPDFPKRGNQTVHSWQSEESGLGRLKTRVPSLARRCSVLMTLSKGLSSLGEESQVTAGEETL